MAWVELASLKVDLKIADHDQLSDSSLQLMLDAAMQFVERVRPEFNYAADPESDLPAPPSDLILGTIRLASRWYTRRRSPDGLVNMAEMGSTRIPSFDPDIERMLGIGRYRGPIFA